MQNYKFKQSTKTRSKSLQTNKVTYIWVLGLFFILLTTAPLWHKFFDKESTNEILGFPNARVFLYACGTHMSTFFLSLFVLLLTKKLKNEIKRIALVVSLTSLLVSLYFLIWAIIPTNFDYPRTVYEIVIIFISVATVILIYFLYVYFSNRESKFIKIINYILYNRVETVLPLVKEEDQAKRAEIALENEDKLKETLNEVF